MSPWNWRPNRSQGMWRHGALWFRPLAQAAPWLAVGICCLVMYVVADTYTLSDGVLFDLPESAMRDTTDISLVAVVLPIRNEVTVFFDDARYFLDDSASMALFGDHLKEQLAKSRNKSILVLSDRRVACGPLARLIDVARAQGASHVLFANRHAEEVEE